MTRRGFLSAVVTAGVGLGTVGTGLGDGGAGQLSSGNGGHSQTPTATPTDEATMDGEPIDAPVIGANLNGRPHRLLENLDLLEASGTTWVRAFLDVRAKLADGGDPGTDPDIVALRRAARERDCNLIVNLKWDFAANWGDKAPMRVPESGSSGERDLCACAAEHLAAIDAPVDVVVLGNEPMWETLDGDIKTEDAPILRFTRTVKDHLLNRGAHGEPQYLVGALNRAHDEHVRTQQYPDFYRQLTRLAREDGDIDGVDLHLHFDRLSEAETMLAVAREAVPDGTILATEFSPVFRYERHIHEPIDASPSGERFRRAHGLPAGITAVEYFERAKRNPRPAGELADFYAAMPWYNVNHVEDLYELFADYDVSVGTFGFLQGEGMRHEDWTDGWQPFHINFLYQAALTGADELSGTANRHYLEDYRRLAGSDAD